MELPSTMSTTEVAVVVAVISGGFTLLGVLLAGHLGVRQARLAFSQQRALQERKDMLGRLEELYAMVDRWEKLAISHHLTLREVMEGRLTYDQANKLNAVSSDAAFDMARMTALADLYFQEARTSYGKLIATRDKIAGLQSLYHQEYLAKGPQARNLAEEINAALLEFGAAVDDYKVALSKYVETA